MEEMEVPTEQLQEEIHHHAHASSERWMMQVALTSALLAVLAALAAMMGGHDANEAMILQIQASNEWSHYQAKSIKAAVQKSKIEMLESLGRPVPAKTSGEVERYEKEQAEISEQAKAKTERSEHLLARHERFAFSLTFFQVGIGIAAIAVLTRRRLFWKVSLGFATVGLIVFVLGLAT